jgi:hypothetical protein
MENDDIKIALFGPRSGKTLFRLYPELAAEPIFKAIHQDDLLFAWYMGIPDSPVDHDWPLKTRYKASASKLKDQEKRGKYSEGDIPEEVKIAIKKFETYSPEARQKAKLMVQRILSNWEEMVNVDVKNDFIYMKDGSELIDFTARKQYIDSTRAISEALPAMLKQVEEGFGITESKKAEDMMGTKTIDKFHQSKQKEQ